MISSYALSFIKKCFFPWDYDSHYFTRNHSRVLKYLNECNWKFVFRICVNLTRVTRLYKYVDYNMEDSCHFSLCAKESYSIQT